MKNNYSYYDGYSEDQFAENEYFRHWVLYAETDKDEFWNNYLEINPDREQTILRARKKVEASLRHQTKQPLTKEEKLILKNTIYQRIGQPVESFRLLRRKSLQLLKFAAIVSGIILVPVYHFYKQPTASSLMGDRTGVMEIKEIRLPDSTVVILNANSSITYHSDINNMPHREITLTGNAYFKVKKKADHSPFTVRTSSLSIAVLGTEFNVNARSKATEVVLTTGKVKLSSNQINPTAVYMNPGEKVRFDTLNNTFIKFKTNTVLYSAWTEGKWNFSSTSLLDITNLIYEYYGIETFYTNEKAKRLMITAVIPVTDLHSFTNILAKTLDLKITAYRNQLHIQL